MRPIRILHLDDRESDLRAVREYLSQHGGGEFEVISITAATDALLYLSNHPDVPLCLVDFDLQQSVFPGSDEQWTGIDFVRSAKIASPITNFIMLSSIRTGNLMKEAAKVGCFGVIKKFDLARGTTQTDRAAANRLIKYFKYAALYSKEFLKSRSDVRLNFSTSISHKLLSTLGSYKKLVADIRECSSKFEADSLNGFNIQCKLNELDFRINETHRAINSILEFYSRQVLEPKPMDINSVVEDAIDSRIKKKFDDYKLAKCIINFNTRATIADAYLAPELIQLAVENLLDNAIKATSTLPDRERVISVSVNHLRSFNVIGFYEIIVEDNGVGLEEGSEGKINEPFYSGENLGRDIASFGIGCAEANKIALMHRNGRFTGSLTVKDRLGERGCRAVLKVPRRFSAQGDLQD